MKKLLFVAYGGGHVAALAPVAKEMLSMGYGVKFLALTTAMQFLEQQGIPYIKYSNLPGATDEDVLSYGNSLLAKDSSNIRISRDESIAYLGLNFREMVRLYGNEVAHAKYHKFGRQSFLPSNLFVKWFENDRPDIVIATNSPRSERAAILAAEILNIPSLCVLDLFGLQEIEWIGQPNYANRVCVLNQQVKDMLIKHGRRSNEIVVTGNPAFESINSIKFKDLAINKRQSMGWGKNDCVILFASQIEPKNHPFSSEIGDPLLPRKIEKKLRDFISNNFDCHLVVRFHPSEDVVFNEGQARVTCSNTNDSLEVLLHAVDIVVVVTSTVGVQAYLAGKQVISLKTSVLSKYSPYDVMGIAQGVSSLDELIAQIKLSCAALKMFPSGETRGLYQFGNEYGALTPTKSIIREIKSLISD